MPNNDDITPTPTTTLDDDDQEVWQYVIANGITPLNNKHISDADNLLKNIPPPSLPKAKPCASSTIHSSPCAPDIQIQSALQNPPTHNKPQYPFLHHGDVAGIDKKMAEKIRQGKIAIQGRIDLHGLTQSSAFPALHNFIIQSQNSGKRCVLVITGKGTRSDGSSGILQNSTPHWLNHPDLRPSILMFCHARPKDGGTGALYVYLRKNKKNYT